MEKKRTNKLQFALLDLFMEKHLELTDSRESTTTFWTHAQALLNSLGPPERSVEEWQKVWIDKEFRLKKKLQHNINEVRATGGGRNTQHSLTDLDKALICLRYPDRLVDHSGAVFETPTSPVASTSRDPPRKIPCNDDCQSDEGEPTRNEQSSKRKEAGAREDGGERGNQPTDYRKTLLEKQTTHLGKIKEYVSDCARYARKSFAIHQKRLKLDEQKFEFEKRVRLGEFKQRKQHLQLMLELTKQKLDMQMGQTEDIDEEEV